MNYYIARCPLKYVLFVGEMLIDFIPNPAGPDGALTYQPHPGGAGANAAVALARLGGSARFLGKLGEDNFGRLLLRVLDANHVDTRFVPITVQGNTTLALVTLQEQGQREFTFYRQQTADTLLEKRDLDVRAWEDVAFCHAGSLLLASEPARSATLAALDKARGLGLLTSFDVNARPLLWVSEAELRAELSQVVARVDLLKLSAEEAHYLDATLSGPLDPADTPGLRLLATKLLAQGPTLVIITRGPLGALLINRQHSVETAALSIQAIDTTGAGDAFMGAALYQLLTRGCATTAHLAALDADELRALGVFANTAAGLSSLRYGGIASLPSLAEIEQG
jgi:fructokinase